MLKRNAEKFGSNIKAGHVYRREMLIPLSTAIDRDLDSCVRTGILIKIAPGIYHKPLSSKFGNLPPQEKELVKTFLRDEDFLILSWNSYNSLGLGLTQLYNKTVVYNHKRHGMFILNNRLYDFRRPARGFPKAITPEFLVVDLINNLKELEESDHVIKHRIKSQLANFDTKKLAKLAKKYGKIATQKFFWETLNVN